MVEHHFRSLYPKIRCLLYFQGRASDFDCILIKFPDFSMHFLTSFYLYQKYITCRLINSQLNFFIDNKFCLQLWIIEKTGNLIDHLSFKITHIKFLFVPSHSKSLTLYHPNQTSQNFLLYLPSSFSFL